MASFTGIDADAADAVLGASIVSWTINGAGHLIYTRGNGSTGDAGDFTAIVTGILNASVAAAVASAVPDAVAGRTVNRGNFNGLYDMTTQDGWNNANVVNGLLKLTATGNITFDIAKMPAGCDPNTQMVVRIQQDATGGRTLTLTGFKKSQGILTLTAAANAVDMVVFMYDGTNWNAGLMGVDFK